MREFRVVGVVRAERNRRVRQTGSGPAEWGRDFLAEAVRFELTDSCPSLVFKTSALNHSATLPEAAL